MNFTIRVFTWGLANDHDICKNYEKLAKHWFCLILSRKKYNIKSARVMKRCYNYSALWEIFYSKLKQQSSYSMEDFFILKLDQQSSQNFGIKFFEKNKKLFQGRIFVPFFYFFVFLAWSWKLVYGLISSHPEM